MKIAILGFGREGKAILKFLKKSARYKNAKISILDRKISKPPHQIRMGAFSTKKIKSLLWCGGKDYLKNLAEFDVVFRSPGVPYNLPEIQNAIKPRSRASSLRGKKGVKFSGGTDLFFNEISKIVRHDSPQVIGITGTKGKGTTSTLLYKILKAAKKDVYLAGNIGKPALEILPKLKKNSIVILELSSFQLQDLKHSPDIAVVLNIFEDHLDSHKNFKEYAESKANIAKWQKKTDKIFYDANNKWSKWIAQKSPAKKIPVNSSLSNSREWFHKIKSIIKIPGEHNLKNAVMAATVAKSLGIPENIILKTVKNYRGMEHRLELVHSNILKNVGMNFYNDSASTNPYTAAAAIRAFPNQPKILICGGKDKNLDYTPLAKALKNSNTKLVILFGENKEKIAKTILRIKNNELRIINVKNLNDAVKLAHKTAKLFIIHNSIRQPADIIHIIFSPAAASFDMFKDYKDRGDKFKKIVKGLK